MYLQKLITNTEGQHGDTVAYNESYENTIVQYHQSLAAFHNAPDVRKAVVQILDDNGRVLPQFTETVIHAPEPEPELPKPDASVIANIPEMAEYFAQTIEQQDNTPAQVVSILNIMTETYGKEFTDNVISHFTDPELVAYIQEHMV